MELKIQDFMSRKKVFFINTFIYNASLTPFLLSCILRFNVGTGVRVLLFVGEFAQPVDIDFDQHSRSVNCVQLVGRSGVQRDSRLEKSDHSTRRLRCIYHGLYLLRSFVVNLYYFSSLLLTNTLKYG